MPNKCIKPMSTPPLRCGVAAAYARRWHHQSTMAILHTMRKVEKIEREVASPKPSEMTSFRQWSVDFDNDNWDAQLTADLAAGRLDNFTEAALKEHAAGEFKPL